MKVAVAAAAAAVRSWNLHHAFSLRIQTELKTGGSGRPGGRYLVVGQP